MIILNQNGGSLLERLFDSLAKKNTYSPVEVIVIDHASTDHTSEVLDKWSSKIAIQLLSADRSCLYASSNNYAAKKAKHPYLLFLHNNIVFTNDILPLAAAQLQDENIGAVGVRLDDDPSALPPGHKPSVQHTGIKFAWDEKNNFHRPYRLRLATLKEGRRVKSGLYPALYGAFLLCRKADFAQLEGFCEEYDNGYEDVDFCLRLQVRLSKKCLCINENSLQINDNALKKVADKSNVKKDFKNVALLNEGIRELLGAPPDLIFCVNEALASLVNYSTFKVFSGKIAVVCHVYYPELWEHIAAKIKNIPLKYHVFASIVDENSSQLRKAILKDFPEATVHVFPNRGKDIAPFMFFLPEIASRGYGLICKVHTKRDHPKHGDAWRKLMMECTLGTRKLVNSILNRFADDPSLGMVGPALLYKSAKALMHNNRETVDEIWQIMKGKHLPDDWGFFAGSIFWSRTATLLCLEEAVKGLVFEDDNTRDDGQLAHALERLFGLCVVDAGYTLALVAEESASSTTRIVSPGLPSCEPVSQTLRKVKNGRFAKGTIQTPQSSDISRDYYINFEEYLCKSMLDFELIRAPLSEPARRVIGYMDCLKRKLIEKYRHNPGELVSVIMPSYNRACLIRRAIESVQKQTYNNWELIIVDDGSTDNTAEVVHKIKDDRIRFFQRKVNGGASRARNDGLAISRGEWIAYLDTDDLWDPSFLLIMINELRSSPGFKAAYSAQFVWSSLPNFDESGGFLRSEETKLHCLRYGPFNRPALENHNRINTITFIHHRSLYEEYGGWAEEMQRFNDWNLVLRYTSDMSPLAIPVILSHNVEGADKGRITVTKSIDRAYKGIDRLLFSNNLVDHFSAKNGMSRISAHALVGSVRKTHYKRKATIIIPSYEAFEYLKLCIESIRKYTVGIEMIVVDNSSSTAVRKYLKTISQNGEIQLTLNRVNYGFSHAVNQGILSANPRNDIVLMNNDAMVTPGWLEALREVVERVPDLGIAVPRQVLLPFSETIKKHLSKVNEKREADVNLSEHHNNVIDPLFDPIRGFVELNFAPFFCVYITRETLNLAGMLDKKNGPHYRSDRLYCDIVRSYCDKHIIYTPHSKVYHFHQRATAALKMKNPKVYDAMFESNDWEQVKRLSERYS